MNLKMLLLAVGLAISTPMYFYATSQHCDTCCECTDCQCDSCTCCTCDKAGQSCQCS